MRNTFTYQGLIFDDDRLAAMQAAVDTSIDGRELNVDTMELTVQTGALAGGFFTASRKRFLTKSGARFSVGSVATLDNWSQADPIRFLRGGSQYQLWYPRKIKRVGPNRYGISATSSLGRLTQMEHRGGVYFGQPAGPLIREICGDVPVYVQPNFEDIPLYGFLPYVSPSGTPGARNGSAKDNLLQVLMSINAAVRDDAEGTLRVENLSTEISSVLDEDRVYRDGASVEDDGPVTSLTLLEHQYARGTASRILFEGTTASGQVIVFSEPCSDLTAQGFEIEASGANYAVVSAGTGTLTGTPFLHLTREITKPVSKSDTENIVRIEDATLVGLTNSGDVSNRLVEYYKHRKVIRASAIINFEDAGDVVSIYDPFDKIMRTAIIEKISPLNVSHTLKGTVEARVGLLPWQTVKFNDVREILTESGTWTAPDNIPSGTEVTAYIIGGGDGGSDGEAGHAGTGDSAYKTFPPYETGSVETSAGRGGEGGAGGAAGNGGRILRVTVMVNPSQEIQYSIGQGGAAGSGDPGEDTVFGAYSSADGAPYESGFTDPITGELYATPGDPGADGGAGGSGGSAGSDGSAGEDVRSYKGGTGGKGLSSPLQVDSVYIGGGGGSGAIGDADGLVGRNGRVQTVSVGYGRLLSEGADGVPGGSREARKNYGDGGHGGHGGSGGGGAGAARYQLKIAETEYPTTAILIGTGGAGGSAGRSSAGVQGCVVLFYRVPAAD